VQIVVREREHAAVGVPDHDRFLGAEQMVRDGERADRLVVDEAARIPDHVCVAFLEAEEARRVEACVHARDDGEPPARRHRQSSFGKPGRVALVRFGDLVDDGHAATSRCCFTS
jgi:hypothetical protein